MSQQTQTTGQEQQAMSQQTQTAGQGLQAANQGQQAAGQGPQTTNQGPQTANQEQQAANQTPQTASRSSQNNNTEKTRIKITSVILIICAYIALIAAVVFNIMHPSMLTLCVSLVAIIGLVVISVVIIKNDAASRFEQAEQSNRTLSLASETVKYMREGLSNESGQAVCELLLDAVTACAVAITDQETIKGFAGLEADQHPLGGPIRTAVTHRTLEDGKTRAVWNPNGISFTGEKGETNGLKATVVAPLVVRNKIIGTLKFFYDSPNKIDETQRALVEGFGQLLSTQLSLSYLEQQAELATRMELKALQAQINPHFLFNTINTIAAYTRTDPNKARSMLREFAVYYRRLLENSDDLIPLEAEVEQTERYLMFQLARFGEDSVEMCVEIEPGLEKLRVPAFVLQPLVENSVGHGRRAEETLHIKISAFHVGESVIISTADDGLGIPAQQLATVVEGGSKTGMGIALKNVDARLRGYFGQSSGLQIESVYGQGATVYLKLHGALANMKDKNGSNDDTISGIENIEES